MTTDRRHFLTASAALTLPTLAFAADPGKGDDKKGAAEEVTATEDLMREHGVLNRILLIYEEGLRRLSKKEEIAPAVFRDSADLVRRFVEDYHEKLEENFIFPEFEKRKKLTDLIKTLRQQHQAGRAVTEVILRASADNRFAKEDARRELTDSCRAFIRMYRPHEAREDTVLFPALHDIVPAAKIKELGEQFEKEEDRLFGDEGFEKNVAKVAAIEKQLSIYDLAQFTPTLPGK